MVRDNESLLTGGAARVLGCSPDNVRHLEKTGRLVAERVNGVRIFRRSDVERLKSERKARCRGAPPTTD
jgi:DNA-binding transcriptional MerR regulator